MKKALIVSFLVFVFIIGIAHSHEDDLAEAKSLIDAKTPCSQLSESQLEIIGDYYMEQMHPGQAHEAMEEMMGGEGSESLKLMHISMGKRLYCKDYTGAANYGMMGSGMMGMMNGGMIGMMGSQMMGANFGYGMMGSGYSYGYASFLSFLSLVLLVGLVILVYLGIFKLWKSIFGSKKIK